MRCTDLVRAGALALTLVSLAGCSEYLARRDAISPFGGNAVEGNKVVEMVDPWPRAAADNRIAYNGAVMQSAVERYRTGRVIPPKGTGTSTTYQPASNPSNTPNNNTPVGPPVNQPASTN
jgi:hypothetical protein